MGMTHPLHDPDDGETTTEMRSRAQRIADEQRADKLTEEVRSARPSRRYTLLTVACTALAAFDWVAVAVHTVLDRGKPLSPFLGTHQILVATLTIVAVCLGVCWALWSAQCERDGKRAEMDAVRHELQMHEIRRLLGAVLREGDLDAYAVLARTQQFLDTAGRSGSVMPFPTMRRPGR